MRASIAVLLGIVLAFVMITALGVSAQQTEDAAIANGTQESAEAHNMTTQIYDGVGQAFGPALAFGGAAAFVLIGAGVLVKAGGQGR
jgi:ABC-type Fe3+ transport system permease subunit